MLFVFVQFSFLQPHPHVGHVYEIYTYININFLDLFVAGGTTVWVVDQIQLTGCKGMLSWFVDMSNKFLFIYICKFNLTWALRFHPLLAKNVYNLDLFFSFCLLLHFKVIFVNLFFSTILNQTPTTHRALSSSSYMCRILLEPSEGAVFTGRSNRSLVSPQKCFNSERISSKNQHFDVISPHFDLLGVFFTCHFWYFIICFPFYVGELRTDPTVLLIQDDGCSHLCWRAKIFSG